LSRLQKLAASLFASTLFGGLEKAFSTKKFPQKKKKKKKFPPKKEKEKDVSVVEKVFLKLGNGGSRWEDCFQCDQIW
jgi:hypothetical protein